MYRCSDELQLVWYFVDVCGGRRFGVRYEAKKSGPVQLPPMAHCGRSNERKNKTERERIVLKRIALQVTQKMLEEKGIKCQGNRWTEQYTFEQTLGVIESLKEAIFHYGGNQSNLPLPMSKRRNVRMHASLC